MSGTGDDERHQEPPNVPAPSDDQLDVTSEHFDPLAALYSDNVVLPVAKPTVFDNVDSFESHLLKIGSVELRVEKVRALPKVAVATVAAVAPSITRNFLPHQMPVKTTGLALRHSRNILISMERGIEGPLSLLTKYVNEVTRVKIYTRNDHGVHSQITGIIQAFDRQWNVAVTGVEETWTRRKYRFCWDPATIGHPNATVDNLSERLAAMGLARPALAVRSLNRKHVECVRRVPGLLVRGEHIILITAA